MSDGGKLRPQFAGSDVGCEGHAAIYSLIGSAKQNGLDLEPYLRDVPGADRRAPGQSHGGHTFPGTLADQRPSDAALSLYVPP